MKVYGAFKFVPLGAEELVGLAKTPKKAMQILKREFPFMRGTIEARNLSSDKDNTFLLDVRELEVEE